MLDTSIAGVAAQPSGHLRWLPDESWPAREGFPIDWSAFGMEAGVPSKADMDSTLWNMTANWNSAYYEIYEDAAWRIGKRYGTGSSAAVLDTSGHYPSMGAAFQKNLHRWGEQAARAAQGDRGAARGLLQRSGSLHRRLLPHLSTRRFPSVRPRPTTSSIQGVAARRRC